MEYTRIRSNPNAKIPACQSVSREFYFFFALIGKKSLKIWI
jgi:hypothetical protein